LKTVFNITFSYLYNENLYSASHHRILIPFCQLIDGDFPYMMYKSIKMLSP